MTKQNATKRDIKVLYQLDSGIYELARIADILPDLGLQDVKHILADLRKKGLITKEDRPALTEKGKKTLESHHKWIFS